MTWVEPPDLRLPNHQNVIQQKYAKKCGGMSESWGNPLKLGVAFQSKIFYSNFNYGLSYMLSLMIFLQTANISYKEMQNI